MTTFVNLRKVIDSLAPASPAAESDPPTPEERKAMMIEQGLPTFDIDSVEDPTTETIVHQSDIVVDSKSPVDRIFAEIERRYIDRIESTTTTNRYIRGTLWHAMCATISVMSSIWDIVLSGFTVQRGQHGDRESSVELKQTNLWTSLYGAFVNSNYYTVIEKEGGTQLGIASYSIKAWYEETVPFNLFIPHLEYAGENGWLINTMLSSTAIEYFKSNIMEKAARITEYLPKFPEKDLSVLFTSTYCRFELATLQFMHLMALYRSQAEPLTGVNITIGSAFDTAAVLKCTTALESPVSWLDHVPHRTGSYISMYLLRRGLEASRPDIKGFPLITSLVRLKRIDAFCDLIDKIYVAIRGENFHIRTACQQLAAIRYTVSKLTEALLRLSRSRNVLSRSDLWDALMAFVVNLSVATGTVSIARTMFSVLAHSKFILPTMENYTELDEEYMGRASVIGGIRLAGGFLSEDLRTVFTNEFTLPVAAVTAIYDTVIEIIRSTSKSVGIFRQMSGLPSRQDFLVFANDQDKDILSSKAVFKAVMTRVAEVNRLVEEGVLVEMTYGANSRIKWTKKPSYTNIVTDIPQAWLSYYSLVLDYANYKISALGKEWGLYLNHRLDSREINDIMNAVSKKWYDPTTSLPSLKFPTSFTTNPNKLTAGCYAANLFGSSIVMNTLGKTSTPLSLDNDARNKMVQELFSKIPVVTQSFPSDLLFQRETVLYLADWCMELSNAFGQKGLNRAGQEITTEVLDKMLEIRQALVTIASGSSREGVPVETLNWFYYFMHEAGPGRNLVRPRIENGVPVKKPRTELVDPSKLPTNEGVDHIRGLIGL